MSALRRFFDTACTGWGVLLLRLGLGIVMFPHGAQKLLGWFGGPGYGASMKFFASMHIPAPLGFLVIMTEFFGALALVLGVFTRLAALAVTVEMIVAVAMVHAANGFFMNWFGNQKGEGFEYHILAITLGVAIIIMGAGRLSIDHLISRSLGRSSTGLEKEE